MARHGGRSARYISMVLGDPYGIHSIPAVVIDGKFADCCTGQGPDADTLRAAGLGERVRQRILVLPKMAGLHLPSFSGLPSLFGCVSQYAKNRWTPGMPESVGAPGERA